MRSSPASGLTLIEVMVALVIVGVVLSGALIGLGAITGSRAKAAVSELGGTMRSLYDTAGLTGRTCRLVFDLGAADKKETDIQYRAECASGALVRGAEDYMKDVKDRHHATKRSTPVSTKPLNPLYQSISDLPTLDDIAAREEDRVENAAKYAAFTSPEVQPRKISGVKMTIWTHGTPKPIDHGVAYLYFFPQGYTERAQVGISQGDNAWTLRISSLTGKTSVIPGIRKQAP